MASRTVDVNERRLRPVYDALDSLNNKKAIQQADKILKKQKTLHCAKVLKSIALLRSGKRDECEKLMSEVKKLEISDDATLQAMTICFREMEQYAEISEIYEIAFKMSPKNEEICTHLFMSYVRTLQFRKQQQIAINLYKTFQKNPYYFWAVTSYVLQANVCDDENTKLNMLLPLAEKMILKLFNEKKIESDAEVSLYLMVLEMQNKYKIALEALDGTTGDFLNDTLKAQKKIQYLIRLERWRDVNICSKELIETRPDEWLNYQTYLESLVKLFEAEYCPSDDDNLSCAVPDYTFSMAMDYVQKRRHKELEKVKRRNRGPFLACLELQKIECEKDINASSKECREVLFELLVEYFEIFGEKSACFSDLYLYFDLLEPAQTSEFLKICRSFLSTSDEDKLPGNITTMSKTITIEKFSRYLCEKERSSSEELIVCAKHCMSLHKDGLKYGEDLLPTDFQHSDEFALLAAHYLLDCCSESSSSDCWLRVLIALESALKSSPSNIQFKLLVSRVYSIIGAVGPCISYMDSMDVKHILYDTLGLNVTRYAAPLGHFETAKAIYNLALKFYQANSKDTAEYVIASYKYGSFEKIFEIMDFKKKLENSFFYASILSEQKFLDVVMLANSATSIHELFVEQKLPECFQQFETWISTLQDNRDLDLLVSWNRSDRLCAEETRKTSFKHELLWLKLRVVTINALALTAASEITPLASSNGQNTQCHETNNDVSPALQYLTILEQLQDLLTQARACETTVIQFPVYGPLQTRWRTYLDCCYDRLLVCLLNVSQILHDVTQTLGQVDKFNKCVEKIREDLSVSSTILTDNASICSKSLTIDDDGKTIFNGRILEPLVLFLEAVSIVLVFLQYFRSVILKVEQISQRKKKKKVVPPTQKELSNAFQTFVESFRLVVSGICDDLLQEEILHLSEDLTILDINELYKMTDSSVLTEIWEKMQTSYKISVQEISAVFKLKMNFLRTLCI